MSTEPRHPRWLVWSQVVVAALAMVMTIPGRTQGLGLITKPVLDDPQLGLDEITYSLFNLFATLLGALFALPFGWMADRWGVRLILTLNLVLLATATWYLSGATGAFSFFLGMMLTRGLGQSSLSATSLTLVGKWFPARLARAMAVFSVISGIGFGLLFVAVGELVRIQGWRAGWGWVGMVILGLAAVAWLFVRTPRHPSPTARDGELTDGVTWTVAFRHPAFWVFALSSGLFNWVSSGIGLFNENVLAELHFDRPTYEAALGVSALFTLITNGIAGWVATRWSLPKLMSLGMLVLAACLTFLPYMTLTWHVFVNAALLGASAGLVMVVFFACWGVYFGRRQLGRIQGMAQAITVLASALGPVSLAVFHQTWGTYRPLFLVLAVLAVLSALTLFLTRDPVRQTSS